jgi:hypothetical protein
VNVSIGRTTISLYINVPVAKMTNAIIYNSLHGLYHCSNLNINEPIHINIVLEVSTVAL